MKNKKSILSNKFKEIVIKCLLVFSLVMSISGPTLCIIYADTNSAIALCSMILGIGSAILSIITVFILGSTFKEGEKNKKDYKIKKYSCTLDDKMENRLQTVYNELKYSKFNSKNYYTAFRKTNEIVVVAVMHVVESFCKEEYIEFMNEIPELVEHILNHTLIVIFIEDEKSNYLEDIINTPEYNSLWDTKVFCIYDENKKILKINKTNSGVGNKAFNDAKKVLDLIFGLIEEKN